MLYKSTRLFSPFTFTETKFENMKLEIMISSFLTIISVIIRILICERTIPSFWLCRYQKQFTKKKTV